MRTSMAWGLRVAAALAALLSATACRGTGARSGRGDGAVALDREAETRAVYAALLREAYGDGAETYVLDPATGGALGNVRAGISDVPADAAADLARARGGRVPADLEADRPIAWFGERDWAALEAASKDEIKSLGAWEAFSERYPRSSGWIRLGAVGFSQDRRFAVTHAVRSLGGLSGSARTFLLERTAEGWRVRKSATTATS
jgi:hypothetical protein